MIELEDVRAVYSRTIALDRVDLKIPSGITGLYGPNGSGKSTLLRVIAGLHRPTRGQVLLDGSPRSASDEDLRRRIAYVGHEAGLYARLSVEENLTLFASLWGADRSRVPEVLEMVGLSDRAGSRVDELSAGLKKRTSVARALAQEPEILLLDEPFASLDDEAADLVTGAIRSWWTSGRVAVIATHGAKRLKSFADGSVVLRRGLIASNRRRVPDEVAR